MNKEKISVIVTIYNRLEYARNVILSLLHQTVMIDELIFADDGSKDDVGEVIKDLIDECPFAIKHVYQEDIGFRLARSRNNGAREATGDFLIFLDQDVIFPDDFIEKIYNARKEKRMVFSKAFLTSETERKKIQKIINSKYDFKKIYEIIYTKQDDKNFRKVIYKDFFYNFLYKIKLKKRGAKIAGLMFSLYKKDFIAINGFDDKFKGWGEEDDDFGNRFFKYGGFTYPVMFKECLIHMYHKFSSTKDKSPNEEYYRKRKKEISRKNYKCTNGFFNSIDKDKVKVMILKEGGKC